MIVTIGILLLLLSGVALLLRDKSPTIEDINWNNYLNSKLDSTERLLGPMARGLSHGGAIRRLAASGRTPDTLSRNLALGGAFGGNISIFYAMQLAACVVGSGMLAISFLGGVTQVYRLLLVGAGILITLWPYNKVRGAAKAKEAMLIDELPEFAELLVMVLTSMSITNALNFTVERSKGVVAMEFRELVRTLNSRAMPEEQAFSLTANRLGTPEGREFVGALQSAHLEGVTAVANIKAQAENLRMLKYQRDRGRAKRLPVSLVLTFAIHFMPLLFILAFLPVLSSLAGLG